MLLQNRSDAPISPAQPTIAAHDRVYRALRTQIMHGEIPPGQALTLRGLGEAHGVSMTPAREALRRLAAEGALLFSASGRVSTPSINADRLEELASLRALLEPELAARALPRALRLQGLGGQITLDPAPMPKNDRRRFEDALRAAFKADSGETALAGWTPLGCYELQRKRARLPLAQVLS